MCQLIYTGPQPKQTNKIPLQHIEFDQNLHSTRKIVSNVICHLFLWGWCDVFLTQYLVSWQYGRREERVHSEVKWFLTGPSIMCSTTDGQTACFWLFACVSAAYVCVFLLCMSQCVNMCVCAGGHHSVQRGLGLCRKLSGQWWGSTRSSSTLTADILQSAADWTGRNKQDTSPGMLMRHAP